MSDPEQPGFEKKSKARLGVIGGAIAAVALTWSVYLVEEIPIQFISLSTHSFFRGLWDVVSFPGPLLAAFFGQEVYGLESGEMTIAGVCFITLANGLLFVAAGGTGGALLDRKAPREPREAKRRTRKAMLPGFAFGAGTITVGSS